jgi:N-acetylmuramoyl-L-alanine amidase
MNTARNIRLTLCLLCGLQASLFAQPANPKDYLAVIARAGEDVPKLLRRYGLADFDCNVSHFFKINKLREDYRLKNGASYKLPLWVVPYNGKSIRSTLDLDDWQTAKNIEQFNKSCRSNGLRDDDFIASKKLWVPYHALHCADAGALRFDEGPAAAASSGARTAASDDITLTEETSGKGNRVFPIFGPKYAKTPLTSRRLRGKVYYLISGHGGPDPGAQGSRAGRTLCEDEYAYDVTLRLLRLLVSHGATAYMIVRDANDGIRDEDYLRCDKDETVWGNRSIPQPQKERLQQRTDLINELTQKHLRSGQRDQTIIEIHVDSRSRETKTDVFFYFRPESSESQKLAQHIHRTFLEKYMRLRGQRGYNGTVTPRYLHTLKETTASRAVYVELANIRNDWDQQRLVLKNNRQALANWLFHALTTE